MNKFKKVLIAALCSIGALILVLTSLYNAPKPLNASESKDLATIKADSKKAEESDSEAEEEATKEVKEIKKAEESKDLSTKAPEEPKKEEPSEAPIPKKDKQIEIKSIDFTATKGGSFTIKDNKGSIATYELKGNTLTTDSKVENAEIYNDTVTYLAEEGTIYKISLSANEDYTIASFNGSNDLGSDYKFNLYADKDKSYQIKFEKTKEEATQEATKAAKEDNETKSTSPVSSPKEKVASQESRGEQGGEMTSSEEKIASKTNSEKAATKRTTEAKGSNKADMIAEAVMSALPIMQFKGSTTSTEVNVTAPLGAFPSGTSMKVRELVGKELQAYKEKLAKESNTNVVDGYAVDITFLHEGKEIEPKSNVGVTITRKKALSNSGDHITGHLKDNGKMEIVDTITSTQSQVTFKASSFSPYGTVTGIKGTGGKAYNTDTGDSFTYPQLSTSDGNAVYCIDYGKNMETGVVLNKFSFSDKEGTGDITTKFTLEKAKKLATALYVYDQAGYQNYYDRQALIWSYFSDFTVYADAADKNRIESIINRVNAGEFDHIKNQIEYSGFLYTPNDSSFQRLISISYRYNPTGSAKLIKQSANPTISNGNSCYSLAGAEFTLTNKADNKTYKLVTGADGTGILNDLPIGTYSVVETKAPKGYAVNKNIPDVTVQAGATATITVKDQPVVDPTVISINKIDSNGKTTYPQGNASLAGAVFEVKFYADTNVSGSADKTWYFKTNEKGRILFNSQYLDNSYNNSSLYMASGQMPLGSFTVKEVKAPTGYKLNTVSYTGKIVQDGNSAKCIITGLDNIGQTADENFALLEDSIKAKIRIIKKDKDLGAYEQGDAKLIGTEFEVVNKSKNPVVYGGKEIKVGEVVTKLTISYDAAKKEYFAETNNLPYGTYTIREVKAGEGYKLSNFSKDVNITKDGETYSVTATNDIQRGKIKVVKLDKELNKSEALGAANLADIDFDIINKSKNDITYEGNTYKHGEVITTITTAWDDTDKEYNAYTGDLPYGTYEVKEVKSNKYYNMILNATSQTTAIRKDNETYSLSFSNQVKRNDIYMVKIADNMKRLNVPFALKLYRDSARTDLIEEHVIVTDENGEFGTDYNPHSQNTNANDKFIGQSLINMDEADYEAGTWFKMGEFGTEAPVDDTLGALPYGFYRLEELNANTNADYSKVTFDFVLTQDKRVINLGTVTDNRNKPSMQTTATSDGKKEVNPSKVTITDVCQTTNISPGKYTAKTWLVDKETKERIGEVVTTTVTIDDDGKFETSLSVDLSKFAGKEVVVFEELYTLDSDIDLIIDHKDINDGGQTITVKQPKIHTTATTTDGAKEVLNKIKTKIIDTVSYENLAPGKYKVKTWFVNKATEETISEVKETEVELKEENGTFTVEMELDLSKFKEGDSIVCYEEIYDLDGSLIAEHKDKDDDGQTIKIKEEPKKEKERPEVKKTPGVKTGDGSNATLAKVLAMTSITGIAVVLFARAAIAIKKYKKD